MVRNIFWGILIFLLAIWFRSCFYTPPLKIQINDSTVTLTRGKQRTVTHAQPASETVFLVNGGSKTSANTGWFAIFSMNQVAALNNKYGSFNNWAGCNSPGASEGMSSLSHIKLIASDPKTTQQLTELIRAAKEYPQVKMIASKLERQGNEIPPEDKAFGPVVIRTYEPETLYLIKDLKILKMRYSGN